MQAAGVAVSAAPASFTAVVLAPASLASSSTIVRSSFVTGGVRISCRREAQRPARPAACRAGVRLVLAAGQSEFASQEAAKLEEELPKVLEGLDLSAGDSSKAAQLCAKALAPFLESYEGGELKPEAFAEMKAALAESGVAKGVENSVVVSAIGWVRGNIFADWKRWSAGK